MSAEPSSLSQNLSRSDQAWLALKQAAEALLAVASAALGEKAPFSSSPPLSPIIRLDEPGMTVQQAINDFLRAKARAGKSDRYLRALRVSLLAFAHGRNKAPLGSVTVADLERWIQDSEWAPRTCRGYISDVSTLFNFWQRRGMVASNPAAAVELPVDTVRAPEIHTPEEVKTVLEFAREYDINVCRTMAIRYFSGLRSAEACRLSESDIKGTLLK